MPHRRPPVKPRRVIFIGVEGKSDRAFARFLQRCCDQAGLHLHLAIKTGHGGDSVDVVKETTRHLTKHSDKRDISAKLVLLDSDRIEHDRQAGRDAQAVASESGLEIIFQNRIWKGCCSGCTKDTRIGETRQATQRRNFARFGRSTASHR